MERFKLVAWMVVVTLPGWWVGIKPCSAGEVVTNEVILKAYNEAHGIMKEQRQRIIALTDGFLVGNTKVIGEQAKAIGGAMNRVAKEFPPAEGHEVAQWRLMASVIELADTVWKASQERDYQKAYLYFSAMTGQCVECHQARRPWGVLPIVKKPPQEPTAPPSQGPAGHGKQ